MPEDVDRAAGLARERLRDGGHVLELALDGVRRRVARRAAAPAVDGMDREAFREHRPDDTERRVVGGRAVDEDERRPVPVVKTAIGVPSARRWSGSASPWVAGVTSSGRQA